MWELSCQNRSDTTEHKRLGVCVRGRKNEESMACNILKLVASHSNIESDPEDSILHEFFHYNSVQVPYKISSIILMAVLIDQGLRTL